MSPLFSQLLIPYLAAMFLAVNMGGSGTAPSFSVAYATGIIRKGVIPGLFGIMVFLGAIIAGKETAATVGQEILDQKYMNLTRVTIILGSVAVSLLIANLAGIPQSTSQATVFAVSATAVYHHSLNNHKLFAEIIPAWFILPVSAFIICYLTGRYIYRPIRKKGWTISSKLNRKPLLDSVIILTSLLVAFSIGANNVANAAGPITSLTINELNMENGDQYVLVAMLSTLIIAPCFGIGSSLFGHKIVRKTGKEIFLFGKFEAIVIALVSAGLLLTASLSRGIPTSLVQLNVGCILGIGVARLGPKKIFRKTQVRQFFLMWLIAPAIAFVLSLLLTWIVDRFV